MLDKVIDYIVFPLLGVSVIVLVWIVIYLLLTGQIQ